MTAVNLATADLFHAEIARLQAEIERLRLALRRLADQDATLSVQGGIVTVTMDATLTDAEREAVRYMIAAGKFGQRDEALTEEHAATLRGLLERMK